MNLLSLANVSPALATATVSHARTTRKSEYGDATSGHDGQQMLSLDRGGPTICALLQFLPPLMFHEKLP